MELSEEDLLSEAVAAHIAQSGEDQRRDLRDEIANRRNVSRSENLARNPAVAIRDGFRLIPPALEESRAPMDQEYFMSTRSSSHLQPNIHPRPRFPSDPPRFWSGSRSDSSGGFDKRHVLHSGPLLPYPPERMPEHKRYVEAYGDEQLPPITDDMQMRQSRSHTSPNEHLYQEHGVSRPFPHQDLNYAPRRDLAYRPPPPRPVYDQPHKTELAPVNWSRSSQQSDSKSSTIHPDVRYELRNLQDSSVPVSQRRSKRRNTRSRVYSEETTKEESFDLMLQQHKREQSDQQQYNHQSNRESIDDNRYQPIRDERYPERMHDLPHPEQGGHMLDHKSVPMEALEMQRSSIPQDRDPLYTPLQHLSATPQSYFEPESSHLAEMPVAEEHRNSTNQPFPDVDVPDDTDQIQEQDGNIEEEIKTDEKQAAADDEEDDEELDTLRLAALLSAYNRNIKKEENFLSEEGEEETQPDSEEKSIKKKSKPTKEKKKAHKKEAKKSPRTPSSEKSFSKTKKVDDSPDIDDGLRRVKSPEKDYSDPRLLTLGNEVMKKKVIEEQNQLREIRKLKDPEEGCKRFMDILNSKNFREQKKLKKSTNLDQGENADNYDEVEMEVEEVSDPTENNAPEILTHRLSDVDTIMEDTSADGLNDAVPQPLPPGVEAEEEVNISLNPRQESIWELLEEPLEEQAAQITPFQTSVKQTPAPSINLSSLISSIRADVDKKISTSESSMPIPVVSVPSRPSTNISLEAADNALKALDTDELVLDDCVDSPCDYEHAFQSNDSHDSYPDIATDLRLAVQDDLSSTALHDEIADLIPNQEDSLASVTPSEEEDDENNIQQSEKRQKRASFEDENELRAKLLNDMALRRAYDSNQIEQATKEGKNELITTVVSVRPERTDITQPSKPSANVSRKKKKLSAKTKQFKRRRYKIRRKLIKQQQADRIKERNLQQVELVAANHLSAVNPSPLDRKNPIQPYIPKRVINNTNTAQTGKIVNSTQSQTANVGSPTKPTSISAAPSVTSTSVPLPARSQPPAVVCSKAAPVATKPASALLGQRMLHPPLVINFDNSSDEDEHVTNRQVRINPAVVKINDNLASPSKMQSGTIKSASSMMLSQQVNTAPTQANAASRKRKAQDETLKSNRANLERAKAESEATQRQLNGVETKLVKVRQLLGQDKEQISRMQQKQETRENELQILSRKAEELKKEMRKHENLITEATNSIEKMKGDASRASSTMEKRRKLESRFIHQISELRQQIVDKTTAISKLETLTNASQVFDANSNEVRNSSEHRDEVNDISRNSHDTVLKSVTSLSSDPIREVSSTAAVAATTVQVTHDVNKMEAGLVVKSASTSQIDKKKNSVQKEKLLLREKERKLQLQKEKYKLCKTEMKLQLIKRKSKQALKAKRLGKSMMEHSIHQAYKIQRRASTSQNQIKPARSGSTSRRSSSSSSIQQANDRLSKDANSNRKSRRRVSITLPTDQVNNENGAASRKHAQRRISTDTEEKKDDSHSITPVTPTLKRSLSDRRSSTSSVTTPTSGGNIDMKKLDAAFNVETESTAPSLSNEETLQLRRKLTDLLLSVSPRQSFNDSSNYLSLAKMFPTPACFKNWSFDVSQLSGQSNRASTSTDEQRLTYSQDVRRYRSPLLKFRSYRLTPLFLLQRKTTLSSNTYSHRMNCNKILCRYDLAGKCFDTKCIGQHFKDITASPNEIYLDLLWYCPALLKTDDGRQITASDTRELQLKAAEDAVQRFCQGKSSKATRTVEESCRIIVGIIKRAYGNRCSFTTVMGKQRPNLSCTVNDDNDDIDDDDDHPTEINSLQSDSLSNENQAGNEPELRYFIEEEKRRNDIGRLELILENDPANERARIELAQAYLDQSKIENKQKKEDCIEFALHALCLGIEINDQSELLWSVYIPILRQHYIDTAVELDQVVIVDQALMLMPLSRPVWDEVFKWNWQFDRLDGYSEDLIENLLARQMLAKSEENPVSLNHPPSYYSSWLLQVIVERTHLLLYAKGVAEAQAMFQTTLQKLRNTSNEQKDWPMCQEDVAKLWLVYVYLLEYEALPPCLYDQDMSSHMFGMLRGFGDVIVQFTSSPRRLAPGKIRQLFKDALDCSYDNTRGNTDNAKRRFAIYKSMVNFEISMEDWDKVSAICRDLVGLFSNEPYTVAGPLSVVDVWVMWAEAIMRSSDVVRITELRYHCSSIAHGVCRSGLLQDSIVGQDRTLIDQDDTFLPAKDQTFDEAVTACPQSPKLAYIAAVYQLTSDSSDEEAALIYLERCIDSLLDLEGAEGLSAAELHQLYRRMLRLDISMKQSSRLIFKSDASQALMEKDKPYLWLIYCTLTELVQCQDEESSSERIHIPDLYEAALHILPSLEDRKIVWIQYLLYLRCNALTPNVDTGAGRKEAASSKRLDQLAWFKYFTSIVRRCLATTPCKHVANLTESFALDDDVKVTDYTFHNEFQAVLQVSSIYLGCFSSNQTPIALTVLTDAMPTNIPLLTRAASYYLGIGDHFSVLSLLWRITSAYSVSERGAYKDIQLWKMTIHALVGDRKFKKAIRLCHRAISVFPRTKDLWHDAITLILAYGDSRDVRQLNERCKTMLAVDIKTLTEPILAALRNRLYDLVRIFGH